MPLKMNSDIVFFHLELALFKDVSLIVKYVIRSYFGPVEYLPEN